eukprot:18956-Heterococcus_DN1.PRE.3
MANLDLPLQPPAFDDVITVLDAGLRRKDGLKALLPVQQTLYSSMTQRSKVRKLIKPESISGAFALSASISAILRRRIVDPSDEITQAGYVDSVLVDSSEFVFDLLSVDVTRRRSAADISLTSARQRPDLMWLLDDTLLFKGEDTAKSKDMPAALSDLLCKMKDWSVDYHGELQQQRASLMTAA